MDPMLPKLIGLTVLGHICSGIAAAFESVSKIVFIVYGREADKFDEPYVRDNQTVSRGVN